MAYRPHCLAKNERNRAMIRDYLAGMTRREVAAKYDLSIDRISFLFNRHGITLSPQEKLRRMQAAPRSPGRKPVWPDCPAELQIDYRNLRRAGYRAAEARAMLDPARQA